MGSGGLAEVWEPGRGERAVLEEGFSDIRYFHHFEMVPVFYIALHVNLFSTGAGGSGKHHKGSFGRFSPVLSTKPKSASQETRGNRLRVQWKI